MIQLLVWWILWLLLCIMIYSCWLCLISFFIFENCYILIIILFIYNYYLINIIGWLIRCLLCLFWLIRKVVIVVILVSSGGCFCSCDLVLRLRYWWGLFSMFMWIVHMFLVVMFRRSSWCCWLVGNRWGMLFMSTAIIIEDYI